MAKTLFEGELLADYFQIYLRDIKHPALPDDYSDEALAQRLTSGKHGIILHTSRNMTVPICVAWHDADPALDIDRYHHVVESSFELDSGELVIAGITDAEATATRLLAPTGRIGVRASLSGLDTISDDGLEGQDRYLIELWPARQTISPKVLKMWDEI